MAAACATWRHARRSVWMTHKAVSVSAITEWPRLAATAVASEDEQAEELGIMPASIKPCPLPAAMASKVETRSGHTIGAASSMRTAMATKATVAGTAHVTTSVKRDWLSSRTRRSAQAHLESRQHPLKHVIGDGGGVYTAMASRGSARACQSSRQGC